MPYDEVDYWNKRLETVGTINTTNGGLCEAEIRLIRKYVKLGSFLLDYGIGGGRTLPLYAELCLEVVGYDIADFSKVIFEKIKELPEFGFEYRVKKEIAKLPYLDGFFDTVVSFSILTHCKPSNVAFVLADIMRLGQVAIISAYDDVPLEVTDETYCFLHDYNKLFADLNLEVLETEKVNKMRFWVLRNVDKKK